MEKNGMKQDNIFFRGEGDNWFYRNTKDLGKKAEFDFPTYIINLLKDKSGIKKIAELGCSNGWRLNDLGETLPNVELTGIDASLAAIQDGQKKYPHIKLSQGLLSNILLDEEYDVVIVYFVLHWVDRSSLAKSIAEIDRCVRDGGILIIGDFYPDFPQRRHYHHLPESSVFTYKQDYPSIFEQLGIYKEITKFTGNHNHKQDLSILSCDSDSRWICSVLHKSLNNYYHERILEKEP
jgi:SAM-dependent methyltransferase